MHFDYATLMLRPTAMLMHHAHLAAWSRRLLPLPSDASWMYQTHNVNYEARPNSTKTTCAYTHSRYRSVNYMTRHARVLEQESCLFFVCTSLTAGVTEAPSERNRIKITESVRSTRESLCVSLGMWKTTSRDAGSGTGLACPTARARVLI